MLAKAIITLCTVVLLATPSPAFALEHPAPGTPCGTEPGWVLTGGPAGCVPANSRLGQEALAKRDPCPDPYYPRETPDGCQHSNLPDVRF